MLWTSQLVRERDKDPEILITDVAFPQTIIVLIAPIIPNYKYIVESFNLRIQVLFGPILYLCTNRGAW